MDESDRGSRAEGSAKGRECRLESSLTPARRSTPRPETWLDEDAEKEEEEEEEEEDDDDEEEEEMGALGTGREFHSAGGRFGGVGGSLSRRGSPGVQGKGRLCTRPSGAAPTVWGRSGGGGGRSRSAGRRGRGLSLW